MTDKPSMVTNGDCHKPYRMLMGTIVNAKHKSGKEEAPKQEGTNKS